MPKNSTIARKARKIYAKHPNPYSNIEFASDGNVCAVGAARVAAGLNSRKDDNDLFSDGTAFNQQWYSKLRLAATQLPALPFQYADETVDINFLAAKHPKIIDTLYAIVESTELINEAHAAAQAELV